MLYRDYNPFITFQFGLQGREESVASSANSRFEPTGMPYARRVTLTSKGFKRREIYMAVASPSVSGLVAMIISFISLSSAATRRISSLMRISSGQTWLMGEEHRAEHDTHRCIHGCVRLTARHAAQTPRTLCSCRALCLRTPSRPHPR